MRKASARVQDSNAEAPGSPSGGDWRAELSLLAVLTSRLLVGGDGAMSRLPAGRAAAGSPGPRSRNGIVQELDLHGGEVAAAPFVPLGVDPYPEGVFPF